MLKYLMMENQMRDKAYLFQGGTLLAIEDTPDTELHMEIDIKLIDDLLTQNNIKSDAIDRYTIKGLGDRAFIDCIGISSGEVPKGFKAVPVRQVMNLLCKGKMAEGSGPIGQIFRCCHINQWRRESRFCGSCGAPNKDADKEDIARQCTVCGRLEFPRISPAIIVVVVNDKDEILLAKNAKFTGGMYSLIAGFNEPGESLEDSILREIKEEVNVDVKDLRYIRSQSWPFPNSLMLGFTARHEAGELRPDGIEIEDARWFTRDNIPNIPNYGSVSRYLIDLWYNKQLA